MKSHSNTMHQTIVSDGGWSTTIGFIWMYRYLNNNNLYYYYADGVSVEWPLFSEFFANTDNQWVHIVVICDYSNKTLKAYKNGVQFGATQNILNTPVFPSTNNVKVIGAQTTTQNKLTDGSLDEVRIYNRGLSAEEVSSIYNATKSKYGY